jgi:hypothetical protein
MMPCFVMDSSGPRLELVGIASWVEFVAHSNTIGGRHRFVVTSLVSASYCFLVEQKLQCCARYIYF